MNRIVNNKHQFSNILENNTIVLVYFSHENCNVCKVLKPKVAMLLESQFPQIEFVYSDTVKNPEIAGQYSVFAVPTIIAFIEGKEYFRRSRNIGLGELSSLIDRPYNMLFN